MDHRFVKRLMSSMKCNVCGQRYDMANVNVLGRQDDLWFVKVSCPSCHSDALVAAVIREGETAEVVNEFTQTDYARFRHASVIDMNDVLDTHNFLKDFDGDFSKLFSEN